MKPEAAPPGRPRDTGLDGRIMAAALAVLRARGPAGVTVEAVAEEARCGKTSIYRRYRNSSQILAAALEDLTGSVVPPGQHLPSRERLVAVLRRFRHGIEQEIGLRAVTSLMYTPDSDFADLMRTHLLAPRLDAVVALLRAAQRAGEVPPSVDPESLVQALAGSYFARLVLTGDVESEWPQGLVDSLWRTWHREPDASRPAKPI